jgi:hypothetical protein
MESMEYITLIRKNLGTLSKIRGQPLIFKVPRFLTPASFPEVSSRVYLNTYPIQTN